jgi:hypothetical protein
MRLAPVLSTIVIATLAGCRPAVKAPEISAEGFQRTRMAVVPQSAPVSDVVYTGSLGTSCVGEWRGINKRNCVGWTSDQGRFAGKVPPGYRVCRVRQTILKQNGRWNVGYRQRPIPGQTYGGIDVYARACARGTFFDRQRSWVNVQHDVYVIRNDRTHGFCDYRKSLPASKGPLDLCDPVKGWP